MFFLRRLIFFSTTVATFAIAETDFKIGPDTILDSLAIGAGDQNYVLVWRDFRGGAGTQQMRALSVSQTGVASADVQISAAGALPLESPVQRNTLAFDPTNNRLMTVWADNRTGAPGIYGVFVTQQGAASGADFLIAPISRAGNNAPLVIFTGADYFVCWQDESSSGSTVDRIFYNRVSLSGSAGSVSSLPLSSGQNHKLEFVLNGLPGELLVVWQDIGATPNVTRGTKIGGNNTIASPTEGVFLFQRDFSVSGFGAPVGAAFDGSDYQILSSQGTRIDSSVFKTRLRQDGSVIRPSSPFAEVGQGATDLSEDSFPRPVFNGSEFLFLRNSKVSDIAYHLLTKRVKLDGTDRDPNMPLIDSASQGVLNGAVAANIGSQYLMVWMDGRLGGAQPQRQLNIFGFFIDDNKAGDETLPYLKSVAHALPIYGNSPLLVTFGNGGSTGIIDSQGWDFGDGAVADVGNTTHTYKTSGDFTAVLSLLRAGFFYRDYIRISVDTNQLGGGGGPPELTAGTPGPVSNGIETGIAMSSLQATLVFNAPDFDTLRLAGYLNPSMLPVNVKDTIVSFTVAGKTYSLMMNADGTANSAVNAKPIVHFGLNRFNGAFVLTTNLDNLASGFAALGATNSAIPKPGIDVVVPYTFSLGTISQTSSVNAKYVAKAGKSGRLSYYYGIDGYPNFGFFRIFSGGAKEGGKTAPVHQLIAAGNAVLPNGTKVAKADSGVWRVSIANFSEDIPVTSLVDNGQNYTFSDKKGKVGVTQFYYIKASGQFGILMSNIPADGPNPSGMPLSTSPYGRVDLAVSLDFALKDGSQLQASGYLRLFRSKAGSKKWKVR